MQMFCKHWIALYNSNIYLDSFGVEHVPKEIKNFLRHKNVKQAYLD